MYIKFPLNEAEVGEKTNFEHAYNVPQCLSGIDCAHAHILR